jgi:hypothetical protein
MQSGHSLKYCCSKKKGAVNPNMPGSVANATPTTVLPNSLSTVFSEQRAVVQRVNEYRGGEAQRMVLVATSRRTFVQTKRLDPTNLLLLRTFRDTVKHGAFYFYHCKEGVFDATGVLTAGRYTVRFDGSWSQTSYIPRTEAQITLVETA